MKKIPLQTIGMIGASILLFSSIIFGFAISVQLQQTAHMEKDFFQESILDQSSALNRVIFAASEYTAYHSNNLDEPGWLDGKIEQCRELISHASIPPFITHDVYVRYIDHDPLFLSERLDETDQLYTQSLSVLKQVYENIIQAKTNQEQLEFILQFDSLYNDFYAALKERSEVMVMVEATYHAQLRTNLAWTQEVVDQILFGQAVAILASLVVMFLSYRSQTRHVKVLKGLIPICAKCKKVRDDKGYWSQVETYIRDRSEADFSHGICPDCVKELYPDYARKMKS